MAIKYMALQIKYENSKYARQGKIYIIKLVGIKCVLRSV